MVVVQGTVSEGVQTTTKVPDLSMNTELPNLLILMDRAEYYYSNFFLL
jgi:hypothetical protein